MFFKGASQCCTPVSVKGPGLRRLLLALSVCVCASEAHRRTAGAPPLLALAAGFMYVCLCFLCYFISFVSPFTDDPHPHARAGEL